MTVTRGKLLYEGKAKRIFEIQGRTDHLLQEFKDSLTAFNGEKKGSFNDKGALNRDMTSLIFKYLGSKGVEHHWIENQGDREMVTQKLEIIPLEVVVRNKAAGSLAKKFKWEEGYKLPFTLVEFYYKSDALGDPFINDDHALIMNLAKPEEIALIKKTALGINKHLETFFKEAGMELIDFKLEFGRDSKGQVRLADEITPDSCRLWDLKTGEKMDKDRFRRDLGRVEETYQEVCARLKSAWGNLN